MSVATFRRTYFHLYYNLLQQARLVPLVEALLAAGKRVEFETNGTIAPMPELLVDGVRFNVEAQLRFLGERTFRQQHRLGGIECQRGNISQLNGFWLNQDACFR